MKDDIDIILKRLQEIRTETDKLVYNDKAEKDRIYRHLELFVRRFFGDASHYLKDFKETNFSFRAATMSSNDYSAQKEKAWKEGKSVWINIIDTLLEELTLFSKLEVTDASNFLKTKFRNIFIVHGQDNEMLHSSARFVTRLGFEPIILREQPNQGRTIIEKFEVFSDVSFAIVLFSPDDLGRAKNETNLKPRPRQNVVFELGFFIGKLGRKNVVVLHNEIPDFEMLSDFQGVLFEPFRDGWEFKVAREIKSAGFDVDLNKLS